VASLEHFGAILFALVLYGSAIRADQPRTVLDNVLALSPRKTAEKLKANQPVKIVCLGDSVTGVYYHTGGRRAYPRCWPWP